MFKPAKNNKAPDFSEALISLVFKVKIFTVNWANSHFLL